MDDGLTTTPLKYTGKVQPKPGTYDDKGHPLYLTSIGLLGKKGEKGGASSRYLLR